MLLGLSAAIVPLPGNTFSSLSIILLTVWWLFFTNTFNDKIDNLKGNSIRLCLMSIPFTLALIGMIYTDDLGYGLKKLQLLLPFLIFSIVIFSSRISAQTYKFVLYSFSLGTFFATFIGFSRALYFKFNSLGNYFYYAKFSELIDKHTTYLTLFVVVSFLFIFHELIQSKLKKLHGIPVLIFFLIILYIASTRISIIALILGIEFIILKEIKSKYKWLTTILPIILIGLYMLPNFQKRFEPSNTEKGEIHDIQFRKEHWLSVLETIQNNSILVGKGTGSSRDFLYNTYKKHELTSAYKMKYNAHNQYLEIVLDYGLIGLVAFLIMLIYLAFYFIKLKDSISFAILFVFLIYFVTESVLQRQDGVVIFSLLMSLLIDNLKNK